MQCWVKIEGARHDAENIVYGPRIMKNTNSNGLDAETPPPRHPAEGTVFMLRVVKMKCE